MGCRKTIQEKCGNPKNRSGWHDWDSDSLPASALVRPSRVGLVRLREIHGPRSR